MKFLQLLSYIQELPGFYFQLIWTPGGCGRSIQVKYSCLYKELTWRIEGILVNGDLPCTLLLGVNFSETSYPVSPPKGNQLWTSELCPQLDEAIYTDALHQGSPNGDPYFIKLRYVLRLSSVESKRRNEDSKRYCYIRKKVHICGALCVISIGNLSKSFILYRYINYTLGAPCAQFLYQQIQANLDQKYSRNCVCNTCWL